MSPSNSPRPYSNGRPSLFNNNSGKNMKRTHKDSNYVTRNNGGERAGAGTEAGRHHPHQQQYGGTNQSALFHNHHAPTSVGAAVTVSSHHTIPPPQRRRTVHFHEKVTVYFPNSRRTESTTNNNNDATYLSMNDLTNIQNDIFLTLDYLHVTRTADPDHGPEHRPVRHPAFVCARGLEDYSTHTKGHLKASTLSRRQRAVFAVLQEQEYQQHEFQRNLGNDDNTTKTNTLRRVYEQYTIPNAIYATKLGREDSEEAFKVYAEDKQQQQEQRQEERQQHQQQQLWHQRPQQPPPSSSQPQQQQLWRQQEPHTQRNYQQGSRKKDVPPTMPRRYGTDIPMIPVEQPKQQQPQPPHHWNFNFQYQEEPPPPFFRCNSSSSSLISSFTSSFNDNSSSHNHQMIVE